MILRDYQRRLEREVLSSIKRGNRRVIMQSPTGSGKTVTFSHMTYCAIKARVPSLVVVHRAEILEQVENCLQGFFNYRNEALCQVRTIQSLMRARDDIRRYRFVVVDECHHYVSDAWNRPLALMESAYIVGASATPGRLDGRGLGGSFDDMVLGPTVSELMASGRLAQYKYYGPTVEDMSSCRTTMGDWNKDDLQYLMTKPSVIGSAIEHYQKYCNNKGAIAFCPNIASSEITSKKFSDAGIVSTTLHSKLSTAERKRRVRDFRNGDIKVLTNHDIVSEGFDVPGIWGVIILFPTQSLNRHKQQIGRVLRTFPGKAHGVVIDHAGNWMRHGLPDDPESWSLNSGKTSRKDAAPAGPRRCENCFGVFPRQLSRCPYCSTVVVAAKRVVIERDGQLEEIKEAQKKKKQALIEQAMATSVEGLYMLALKRGYKHPRLWAERVHSGRKRAKRGR